MYLLLLILTTFNISYHSQDDCILQYESISRGSYLSIHISSNQIILKTTPDDKGELIPISQYQWKQLIQKLNQINLENISKEEAPSKKRLYDGAAHAQLLIIKGGKHYQSQPFDHGHPPKGISSLVKAILTLSQTVE